MSLGLARRKELQKRRNQKIWMLIKSIFIIAILVGCSYFAFDTGQKIALRGIVYNQVKFDQQTRELEDLRLDLGNKEAALSKMQTLLPNEAVQNLLQVINRKNADGIALERIATLIAGMSRDAECSDEPQTKRLVVTTPIAQSNEGFVSFYRGLITITGKGSPTLNENGNPEAWFDPAKPVTMVFTLPGGEAQETTGPLPLYHSVLVNKAEYRFTIAKGRTSFADITVRRCTL